jgi:hypothetical protein
LALALYFVRVSLIRRSLAAAPARMLTLDGRSLLHVASCETACAREHLCACTHYLVFKEPECPASLNATVQPRRVPTERPFPSVLGEPSEVTTDCPGCQPHAVC